MVTWVERSNFFGLVSHLYLIIDFNVASTSFHEKHEVIFFFRRVLGDYNGFRFMKLDPHSGDNVVEKQVNWALNIVIFDYSFK